MPSATVVRSLLSWAVWIQAADIAPDFTVTQCAVTCPPLSLAFAPDSGDAGLCFSRVMLCDT